MRRAFRRLQNILNAARAPNSPTTWSSAQLWETLEQLRMWSAGADNWHALARLSERRSATFLREFIGLRRALELACEYAWCHQIIHFEQPRTPASEAETKALDEFLRSERYHLPTMLRNRASLHRILTLRFERFCELVSPLAAGSSRLRENNGVFGTRVGEIQLLPPTDETAWRVWYAALSTQVQREDALISDRLRTMMSFQGFMFTTAGLLCVALGQHRFEPTSIGVLLVMFVAVSGMMVAYNTMVGCRSAYDALSVLRAAYSASLIKHQTSAVPPFGDDRPHRLGHRMSHLVPQVTIGVWLAVAVAALLIGG